MNRPFENLGRTLAENITRDVVKLHPQTVANAAVVAKHQKAARRRKPAKKPPVVVQSMTVRIPREIMETALRLADGDMRRIVLQADGSAIVYNHPRTSPVTPQIRNRGTRG